MFLRNHSGTNPLLRTSQTSAKHKQMGGTLKSFTDFLSIPATGVGWDYLGYQGW
jgi:hypothetical protein